MSEDLVTLIARVKAQGDFSLIAEKIPYLRFLGIDADTSAGHVVCRMRFAPHLVGNRTIPALHGGTIGALLESAAVFQILWEAETVALPKTINLTVDYLHSARAVDTYARGIVTKHGRRVVNVRAEAWQEDPERPVAVATAHFLVLPPGPSEASGQD